MSEQIKVFTTPTCPYCTKIKEWLDEHDYDYEEYNVADNKEKAKEMIEKTGQRGVPQTFVGDEVVIGFQPNELEKAIEEEIKS